MEKLDAAGKNNLTASFQFTSKWKDLPERGHNLNHLISDVIWSERLTRGPEVTAKKTDIVCIAGGGVSGISMGKRYDWGEKR